MAQPQVVVENLRKKIDNLRDALDDVEVASRGIGDLTEELGAEFFSDWFTEQGDAYDITFLQMNAARNAADDIVDTYNGGSPVRRQKLQVVRMR